MLVVYPLPDKGHRYSIWRGSGLSIYLLGVWRCLLEDRQEHHSTLFHIVNLKVKSGMEATSDPDMDIIKHLYKHAGSIRIAAGALMALSVIGLLVYTLGRSNALPDLLPAARLCLCTFIVASQSID